MTFCVLFRIIQYSFFYLHANMREKIYCSKYKQTHIRSFTSSGIIALFFLSQRDENMTDTWWIKRIVCYYYIHKTGPYFFRVIGNLLEHREVSLEWNILINFFYILEEIIARRYISCPKGGEGKCKSGNTPQSQSRGGVQFATYDNRANRVVKIEE